MRSSRLRPLAACLALIIFAAGPASAIWGLTALENAAHKGDLKKVKDLLDKGADVNEFKYGTALMIAAQDGHIDVAKLLLDRGADPNIMASMGWTALGMAADAGKLDMVDLLITRGADVDKAIAGVRTWAEWTAGPPVRSQSKAQQILKAIDVIQGRAGLAYYSAGQYDKALAVFQSSVKQNPNDVESLVGLAFSATALKKYDDARGAAEAAVKLAPGNADAHTALGDALKGQGHAAAAVDALKKAVELSPKNPWVASRLGGAYYQLDDYPNAIACFRKAADLAPDSPGPLRDLFNACARAGQFDAAIAASDRLLTMLPSKDTTDVLGFRSLVYREKGMPLQAAAEAGKAASIDPNNDWSRTALAAVALDKGNYDETIRQLSGVADKEWPLPHLIEAVAYAKKGDTARAEQIYGTFGHDAVSSASVITRTSARALADLLKPATQAHLDKAASLEAGPDYKQAVAEYALAIRAADDAGAKTIRTRVAAIIKAHPEVGELPESARKFVMRGEVLVDEKKPAEAIAQYAEASRLAPFYPNTYYNMAVLSASQAKFKEAVNLMHAFLDLAPDDQKAREARDLTYKWEFMIEQEKKKYEVRSTK